jgi:hypothetical protein
MLPQWQQMRFLDCLRGLNNFQHQFKMLFLLLERLQLLDLLWLEQLLF